MKLFQESMLPTIPTAVETMMREPGEAAQAASWAAPAADGGSAIFVWSAWALMTAVGVAYVAMFGLDVPRWDDYTLLPQSIGVKPITLSWLWSLDSEHRIPLTRLLLVGLFRLGGADPRPAMFVTVGLLGALAAGLLRAARAARGSAHYSDAFLPIILLNLGHNEILLWAFCVGYAVVLALVGFWLALIVRCDRIPGLSRLARAALLTTLLPLCGGGGLLFAAAMIFWFWYIAAASWRSKTPGSQTRSLIVLACSLPALCTILLYFRGYYSPRLGPSGGLWAAGRTAAQSLAMSLGYPGPMFWPWSAIALGSLLLGAFVILGRAWLLEPAMRASIAGLACVLGSVLLMELGLGWSRSGQGEQAGFQYRYTLAAVPALLAAYFAFALHGPRLTRQLIPMLMFTGSCLFLWPNTQEGWVAGYGSREVRMAFDRDLAAGTPVYRLVRRYTPTLHPSQQVLRESLEMLHQAGIGKFRSLRLDPRFREQAVALGPGNGEGKRGYPLQVELAGVDSWIHFDLPAPVRVSGIRMRYTQFTPDDLPARFRMAWQRPEQRNYPADQQYTNWNFPGGNDVATTIWVDDIVSRFRIQPDNRPGRFTISDLVLLVSPQADLKSP